MKLAIVIYLNPRTMKKFLNAFSYDFSKIELEKNNSPSLTQPEMTLSLKELISRYTRGGQVATFTPVYTGDGEFDEYPEFEKMDAVEKMEYAARIKESIHQYQNRPEPKPEPKTEPKPEPKPEPKEEPKPDAP